MKKCWYIIFCLLCVHFALVQSNSLSDVLKDFIISDETVNALLKESFMCQEFRDFYKDVNKMLEERSKEMLDLISSTLSDQKDDSLLDQNSIDILKDNFDKWMNAVEDNKDNPFIKIYLSDEKYFFISETYGTRQYHYHTPNPVKNKPSIDIILGLKIFETLSKSISYTLISYLAIKDTKICKKRIDKLIFLVKQADEKFNQMVYHFIEKQYKNTENVTVYLASKFTKFFALCAFVSMICFDYASQESQKYQKTLKLTNDNLEESLKSNLFYQIYSKKLELELLPEKNTLTRFWNDNVNPWKKKYQKLPQQEEVSLCLDQINDFGKQLDTIIKLYNNLNDQLKNNNFDSYLDLVTNLKQNISKAYEAKSRIEGYFLDQSKKEENYRKLEEDHRKKFFIKRFLTTSENKFNKNNSMKALAGLAACSLLIYTAYKKVNFSSMSSLFKK